MTDILHVPPAALEAMWPLVREHLGCMAEGSRGRYLASDIENAIRTERMQLWLAVENVELLAAGVSEIVTYPRTRALRWIGVSGRDTRRWLAEALDAGDRWARSQGCSETQAFAARRGWIRLFGRLGFSEDHILLSKAI